METTTYKDALKEGLVTGDEEREILKYSASSKRVEEMPKDYTGECIVIFHAKYGNYKFIGNCENGEVTSIGTLALGFWVQDKKTGLFWTDWSMKDEWEEQVQCISYEEAKNVVERFENCVILAY